MIKCVIFDNDGTLVDSEILCCRGLAVSFNKLGIPETTKNILTQYKGWRIHSIMAAIEEKHQVTLPDTFIPEYRTLVAHYFENELRGTPNIEHALNTIELPVCVASSGPVKKIRHALQVTGLARYFGNNIFSAFELQVWKPDPGLFLHAAQEMGFTPSECAVIEDSEVGLQAGIAAGIITFFYNPDNQKSSVKGVIPFNDMAELPSLLHLYR